MIVQANRRGHDRVARRVLVDPGDKLPGAPAVGGACAEGPALFPVGLRRCQDQEAIVGAVDEVVRPRRDAALPEQRQAERPFPAMAAVGRVIEP